MSDYRSSHNDVIVSILTDIVKRPEMREMLNKLAEQERIYLIHEEPEPWELLAG